MNEEKQDQPSLKVQQVRRKVAKRACLACRERKIKCDGEQEASAEDGNNSKHAGVCSNCRILGIECIFVQSMRGGKRKKSSGSETAKSSKESTTETSRKESKRAESITTTTSIASNSRGTQFSSTLSSISDRRSPFQPQYSTTLSEASKADLKDENSGNRFDYEYNDYNFLPPPIRGSHMPKYFEEHEHYMYKRLPHSFDYPPQVAYRPPPPPIPTSPRHGLHPHPLAPPYPHMPHRVHPHLHLAPHPTRPPYPYGYGHDYRGPRLHDHEHDGPHPHGPHPHGPHPHRHHHHHHHRHPHSHHHHPHHFAEFSPHLDYPHRPPSGPHFPPRAYTEYQCPKEELVSGKGSPRAFPGQTSSLHSDGSEAAHDVRVSLGPTQFPHSFNANSPFSRSIEERSIKPSDDSVDPSYRRYPKVSQTETVSEKNQTRTTIQSPRTKGETGSKDYVFDSRSSRFAFFDSELEEYRLPPWDVLEKHIDLYYIRNHPKHQILPAKSILLRNISLKFDSSILHAILATVATGDSSIGNQKYWISMFENFSDTLDDFGFLLGYTLVLACADTIFQPTRYMEVTLKMWNIIKQKKFIETTNTTQPLNSRQKFKTEVTIRIIWRYWCQSVVWCRFRQGWPYSNLCTTYNEVALSNEIDCYTNNLTLPLSGIDHLSLQGKRLTWHALNNVNFETDSIPDTNILILCFKFFEVVLNRISNKEKSSEVLQNNQLIQYTYKNIWEVMEGEKLLVINASFLLSAFLLKMADLIQWAGNISDILVFGLHRYTNEADTLTTFIDEFSMASLLNFEDLPKALEGISEFQWSCLFSALKTILDIVKLLRLGEGRITGRVETLTPVLGPTLVSQDSADHWWRAPELRYDPTGTWCSFPEFSLNAACSALSILCSIIVLTRFIKCHEVDSKLKVDLHRTKKEKLLSLDYNEKIMLYFNEAFLIGVLSILINFIKRKISIHNDDQEVIEGTKRMINKVSHYLEEILDNLKEPKE